MIPIVTISVIFVLILSLIFTLRVYFSYLKTKSKTVKYLLQVFVSFDLAALIFSPTGILIKDLNFMNFIFNIYIFPLFVALAFFVALTLEIMDKPKLKVVIFSLIVILGLVLSLKPALDWQPAIETIQGPFVFWEDSRGVFINNFIGISLAIMNLWVITFFLYNGLKNKERYVRNRSLLIAASVFCFLIASITDYVFGANTNIFYISIYTCLWDILAVSFLLFASEYKQQPDV